LWSGGDETQVIKEQTYPGRDDELKHFNYLIDAFRDKRYIKINGMPLFLIYRPVDIPDCKGLLDRWRQLASEAGLPGIYIVANLDFHEKDWSAFRNGFDAVTVFPLGQVTHELSPLQLSRQSRIQNLISKTKKLLLINHKSIRSDETEYPEKVYLYELAREKLVFSEMFDCHYIPMAVPRWDTTPRYGKKAIILHNSTPDLFKLHFQEVVDQVQQNETEKKIVFLKSWNEWAEGNYLEPDRIHKSKYLESIKSIVL
jgi:hypothetical protein